MTDEVNLEELAEQAEKVDDQVTDAVEQTNETPEQQYEASQEEMAAGSGWKPLEEWVEGGGEAKDWVPASIFNVRGEFIGKLKAKDRELDSRLANVNQIHQVQLEQTVKELTEKRDAAALEGGQENLEVVKNAQYQIDQLTSVPQPIATGAALDADPLINQWNAENPWITEPGAKSTYARSLYQGAKNAGWTAEQTIQHINSELSREFPTQTRTKPVASETEKGSKPSGFKKQDRKLTMSDLTADEHKMIKALPGAWAKKSDDEILQAVQDARNS